MSKLNDTEAIILSKSSQRDDGAASIPDGMNRRVASKVAASLVARKLMREIRSKPGMPVWRMDEDGRPKSLVLLAAGREAIGVDDEVPASVPVTPKVRADVGQRGRAEPDTVGEPEAPGRSAPRTGSKRAHIIDMLSRGQGATLSDLIEATSWLPHTTRAALTGLRKRGFAIDRKQIEGKGSLYRIVGKPADTTA